jgi:hypothetical protein
MPWTTAMIATEMPAAIRPYSIAVAPESSYKNRLNVFMAFLLDDAVRIVHPIEELLKISKSMSVAFQRLKIAGVCVFLHTRFLRCYGIQEGS